MNKQREYVLFYFGFCFSHGKEKKQIMFQVWVMNNMLADLSDFTLEKKRRRNRLVYKSKENQLNFINASYLAVYFELINNFGRAKKFIEF